ncbi:hypothetical protein BSKO_09239 [Bryopsis sp. KO-2023]|nr:hypothetical protein BSKO_09239 [Bryopsis sp. KO-2023]
MSIVVGEDVSLFEALARSFDHRSHTSLRIPQGEDGYDEVRIYAGRLFDKQKDGTLAQYSLTNNIAPRITGCGDYTCGGTRCPDCNSGYDDGDELEEWQCVVSPGNCLVPFQFEGKRLWMLTREEGPPVAQRCGGPVKLIEVILFAPGRGSIDVLKSFVKKARIEVLRTPKGGRFGLYRWHLKQAFWVYYGDHPGRDPSTLILPQDMCTQILSDLKDFFSVETRKWYISRGIPYKRSLLLYGPPGSGKSSVIKMVASECGRSVCYLQPAGMSDSALADAVEDLPRRTVLVLEDVDALFAAGRESTKKQKLTFSGVLNTLDGLLSPQNGQLIIMTSNHPEKLDPAMIRSGRVDRRFELSSPTTDQAERMFHAFYPDAASTQDGQQAAETFAQKCLAATKLSDYPLSMASLQNYFILGRGLDHKTFLEKLPEFIDDELAISNFAKHPKNTTVEKENGGVDGCENGS